MSNTVIVTYWNEKGDAYFEFETELPILAEYDPNTGWWYIKGYKTNYVYMDSIRSIIPKTE